MPEWTANIIYLMTIGVFTLTGLGMKLWHDRRKGTGNADEIRRLREDVDALREDATAHVAELHERLDFAERLLAQRRIEPAEPHATTPV